MDSPGPDRPTLRHLLLDARARLTSAGIDDADMEAELLLRMALRDSDDAPPVSRSKLFSALPEVAPEPVSKRLDSLLARRLSHEPSAYIAGTREFYGLDFAVTPDVLIPRPETELLVETALDVLRSQPSVSPGIVDAGTGSGAIAVALAVALPRAVVYATDVSQPALAVARANAARHRVDRRISFRRGDLLLPLDCYLDFVVANLPYVTSGDWARLPPELREHEPRLALDGGDDGLDLIHRLLGQAPRYLNPGGALCIEFGPGQAVAIDRLAQTLMPGSHRNVLHDLAGLERAMLIRLPTAKSG